MAVSYNPGIVTDGLVLYLDPANLRSYPGNGTAWYDLSGYNYHGTLINGTAFTNINNGVILFDGINDYVDFVSNNILTSANTIEIWFKLNSTSNGALFCAGDDIYDSSLWDWSFFQYSGVFYGRARPGAGGANLGTLTSYLNTWYVLTMVRSTGLFYKNGVYLTNFSTGSTISKPLRLGKAGAYFNGSVGSIKIYNRALSAAEIYANYNATKGRYRL